MAASHDFISQFSDGYDSSTGDQGVLLSGGERQKIAICRALLRRPKLLILDEPTNHLDQDAVQRLIHNLRSNGSGWTTLIISHDWEIVREADQIYYLEKKQLREISYEELSLLTKVPGTEKRQSK